jgi:hypothetical protein
MRLFAFGCSFTQYYWPTWADILGKECDSYENWGRSGGGNQFIFHSLMECAIKKKISKDDTVIIMWTSVSREDRYVNHQWHTPGNIFCQSEYDKKFVKKFADIRGYSIRDFNTIYAAEQVLKTIGCKFYFLSMVSLTAPDPYSHDKANNQISDVLLYVEPLLDQIRPSVHEIIFNFEWKSHRYHTNKKFIEIRSHYEQIKDTEWPECLAQGYEEHVAFISKLPDRIKKECYEVFKLDLYSTPDPDDAMIDHHPIPSEHLAYLEKVLPEITISRSTKDWVNYMDKNLRDGKNFWKNQIPERW